MGPKSIRDADSPSASSFLLPQLRQSRRGSLASLSSTSQLDKETLSQALDQIHNTASQTETLTTFNEYTSPPTSSSGPENKGIASELQGGLSGLYSRFRASVGNVKDVVNVATEDVAAETPLKSPRAATHSPKPLSKNGLELTKSPSSANSIVQAATATGSGRQSPLGNVDTDRDHRETRQSLKASTKSLGSASASAKSVTGSLAALKSPPVTLTQAAQLTTISPALADVNVSAIKRMNADVDSVSKSRTPALSEPQNLSRNFQRQSRNVEPCGQEGVDTSDLTPPEGAMSRTASQGGPNKDKDEPVPSDSSGAFQTRDRPGIVGSRAVSTDSVRPFPDLEDGADQTTFATTDSLPDPNDPNPRRPIMVVTTYSNGNDDVFDDSKSNGPRGLAADHTAKLGGDHPHIGLSLRKTIAPPLITRSHSSKLSLSRASTSDTESLEHSPLPARSHQVPAGSKAVLPIQSNGSQPIAFAGFHRDSRTINLFSQVKNKVLNRKYWMKDENARDCFYCGDAFSTFRRKHHCSKS